MDNRKIKRNLLLTLKIIWIPAILFFAVLMGLIGGYGFIMAHASNRHRDVKAILELGRGILNREIWIGFISQIKELR